uniref:type II toxin-antitoxin system VapC family toxin n=1 Tax=uncultured Sphingomonas sp. TaxID=158754 RepID=UPI0035CA341A
MTMLVVNASVAVKFVFREPGTTEVRAFIAGPELFVAPDWILPEVAHALWNKVKHSELLQIHAEYSLERLPAFFARLYPAAGLTTDAFSLALRFRHSVYDCLYLALALRERAKLLTADKKLHQVAQAAGLEHALLVAGT